VDNGQMRCYAGGTTKWEEYVAKRDVKVKSYKSRRTMQRDMTSMLKRGYRLESQSGQFSPWTASFIGRKKVVVTYVRERD
jgi:hypothetical protein